MVWPLLGLGFWAWWQNTILVATCHAVPCTLWSFGIEVNFKHMDVFHVCQDIFTVLLPLEQGENFVHVLGGHEQNLELVCSAMLHGRACRFTGLDMGALSFSYFSKKSGLVFVFAESTRSEGEWKLMWQGLKEEAHHFIAQHVDKEQFFYLEMSQEVTLIGVMLWVFVHKSCILCF